MVHGNLSAYGTVDHAQKRCRELDKRNAALVGGSTEASHVADHATAKLQQAALAGVAAVEHKAEQLVQVVQGLVLFAGLELENRATSGLASQFAEHLALNLGDVRVCADQEVVTRCKL